MTNTLTHRGPDDGDYWIDPQAKIALGHRRLSIIDLNPTGNQPMTSSQGKFLIVYNGEIYNYLDLKRELDAATQTQWRGTSDTEVLLRGFEHFGIKEMLEKSSGMFALALYDKKRRKLILARDRMGEKPLYYGWVQGIFVFGSELKILKGLPSPLPPIDQTALAKFFRYGYIPGPETIFEGIKKLPPGTYLEIDVPHLDSDFPQPSPYWEAKTFLNAPAYGGSFQDATDELEKILLHSVSQASISDVPLGAFLSGGLDSSLIAALMQTVSKAKIQTFTIGFHEDSFDEAIHAQAVAKHLGTEHHEHYITSQDVLDIIPRLPLVYDEPFADSSQIPTLLLSAFTKSKVKVALSGDGADELFAGYTRYAHFQKLSRLKSVLPSWANHALATAILPLTQGRRARSLDLLHKGALLLKTSEATLYETMISLWKKEEGLVRDALPFPSLEASHPLSTSERLTKLMYADLMTYLPDDIMVKVDRASMSQGLETRAPFLDLRVVEFACSLPLSMKYDGRVTKKILRNILYKYIPQPLLDRPKQGFGVPLQTWLRGPLKAWAGDLLSPQKLARHGYLNDSLIHQKWEDHLAHRQEAHYPLWAVLMFQSWYDTYKD